MNKILKKNSKCWSRPQSSHPLIPKCSYLHQDQTGFIRPFESFLKIGFLGPKVLKDSNLGGWPGFHKLLVVKNLPAGAGDIKDMGLIPGRGRSHGGGDGNPLRYSFLGNPMIRGTWWAVVHRTAGSDSTEGTEHRWLPWSPVVFLCHLLCLKLVSDDPSHF